MGRPNHSTAMHDAQLVIFCSRKKPIFTNGAALFQGFVDFIDFGAKGKDSRIMSSTISLSDRWLIQSD